MIRTAFLWRAEPDYLILAFALLQREKAADMSSCPFVQRIVDAAGKPGEGAHKWHVGPIAVVDFLLTVVAVYALWYLASKRGDYGSYCLWLAIAMVIATIVHWSLGINTGVVVMLKKMLAKS